MKLFYHENLSKNSAGFLKFSIGLILTVIAIVYAGSRFGTWQKIEELFGQGKYKNVSIDTLVAYSNVYSGQLVCTQGTNAKTHDFNVLKSGLRGDEFTNAILVKFASGHQSDFDSFIPNGMAAVVYACGKFEARRGSEFGTFGAWNSQLTVDSYKLLEAPKPFSFD